MHLSIVRTSYLTYPPFWSLPPRGGIKRNWLQVYWNKSKTPYWMESIGTKRVGHVLIGHTDAVVASEKGTMLPRATGPVPTQTLIPSHSTMLCSYSRVKERRGAAEGSWQSLHRPEERHTGAMAIPKTTYLLSLSDSACQNNCQDTQPARNRLTCPQSEVFLQRRLFNACSHTWSHCVLYSAEKHRRKKKHHIAINFNLRWIFKIEDAGVVSGSSQDEGFSFTSLLI